MLASKQVDGSKVTAQEIVTSNAEPDSASAPDASAARLRIAIARLSRRLRPTAAAGALTATEIDVLIAAERRGPIRLSDLASFAGLNPTMLSRLVPKLEDAGLLRRLGDDADRRVCRVEATATGRSLLQQVRSERNDVLSRRLAELDPSRREALVAAIAVLEELSELLPSREMGPSGDGQLR
jgi:DNA-binding MarR family transcriptional regulator